MTITYSLWQGSQLLSVNNKASNSEEILSVMKELEWEKAYYENLADSDMLDEEELTLDWETYE